MVTHNRAIRNVTCRIGLLSVTCHPTMQVNATHFNPSQVGRGLIYPGRMEGWVFGG